MKFQYAIHGTAAGGQTWTTVGEVESGAPGAFARVPDRALRDSFEKLTQGKAEYGKPGPCGGPFTITYFLIQKADDK